MMGSEADALVWSDPNSGHGDGLLEVGLNCPVMGG